MYLEGQFGAHSVAYLVNNLCIEAPTVVHVTHQNWKCLENRQISHAPKRKHQSTVLSRKQKKVSDKLKAVIYYLS